MDTVQPHSLCALCKSFWERATCLEFTAEELAQGAPDAPAMPQHLLHSYHRQEIDAAAERGCHFCSIIVGSIVGCTGDHTDRRLFAMEPLFISIDVLNASENTFALTIFPCEQSKIFSFDLILNSYQLKLSPIERKSDPVLADRELLAKDDTHPSSLTNGTLSGMTVDGIKAWIKTCKESHFMCSDDYFNILHDRKRPPSRPRRVLDVRAFSGGEKIQLVEVEKEQTLEYCALSYSWGFTRPYKMTSSNMNAFKQGIALVDLPKTIQDAIQVVRELGFRYLWIDALCIMQDGETSSVAYADWEDQANKMGDIFGGSVVTIAASESFDGEQGFIQARNPLRQSICRLDVNTKHPFEVVPPCTPYCLAHPFDKAQYHLDTRAWVYQERALASRTLHFTRNFLHMECRTELVCERGEASTCHHSGAVSKAEYQLLFNMFGPEGLLPFAVDGFLSYWHRIVTAYSLTNLSRASDLLIALAGIAQQIHESSQLTYSFGLWREHIISELLWYVRGGKASAARERAPSWSWASVEVRGPKIMYEPSTKIEIAVEVLGLPEASRFDFKKFSLSAEGARYCIKLKGKIRTGAPIQGSLISDEADIHVHVNPACEGIPTKHPECPFHPDYDLPEGMPLYSLLVAYDMQPQVYVQPVQGELSGWETELGLVLTPLNDHQGRYRRVGYFHHKLQYVTSSGAIQRQPSFFRDSDPTLEIEIV